MRTRFDSPWLLPALLAAFALAFYWLLPDVPDVSLGHSVSLANTSPESAARQHSYYDLTWLDRLVSDDDLHAGDLPYREWVLAVLGSEDPGDQFMKAVFVSGHLHFQAPLLVELVEEGVRPKLTLSLLARPCQLLRNAPLCDPDPVAELQKLDPGNAMPLDLLAERALFANDTESIREIIERASQLERIDFYELEITRLLGQSKARHGLAPALSDLKAFARIRGTSGFAHGPTAVSACLEHESDPQWREICTQYAQFRARTGTSSWIQLMGWLLIDRWGEVGGAMPDLSTTLSNRKDLWRSAHETPLTEQQWQNYLHNWETQGELEAEIQLMAELDDDQGR
ncbi:hypothetical protein [Marinimicrobium sp. ABcell2]|uniref:hypothetical protein n=1 Tax=Marinimicrobium sp. ABcell2 TaxID=3069751 RepID=UPI0027AEF860|nr:hypothetical protein [Marinimicrobium sp. ABcell2]MDQ2076381.1 hypothetical protein [Marinimicrobium sp. ABcell2]